MKISADSLSAGTAWQNTIQKSEQSASFQPFFNKLLIINQEDYSAESEKADEKTVEETVEEFGFNELKEEMGNLLTTLPMEDGYFIQSKMVSEKTAEIAGLVNEEEAGIILSILNHSLSMEDLFAQLEEHPAEDIVKQLTVLAGIMQLPGSKEVVELKNEVISHFTNNKPDLVKKDTPLIEALKIFEEYDQSENQMNRPAINRFNLLQTAAHEKLNQSVLRLDAERIMEEANLRTPQSARIIIGQEIYTSLFFRQNMTGSSGEISRALDMDVSKTVYPVNTNSLISFEKSKFENTEVSKSIPAIGVTGPDAQSSPTFSESVLNGNAGKSEVFTIAVKESSGSPNQQLFNNQITEAFKRSKPLFTAFGSSQMTIRLAPEHLGMLTVKLQQHDGKTIAKIITSTQSAKELVEQGIQQLKQVLPAMSIQVDRFEIYGEQLEPSFSRKHEEDDHHHREQEREELKEDEKDTFKTHLNMLT
ncbi:flagellar hook-length control protein FliK [Metabacillus idriensis]|uniref:flagellar hook-length control protein FliK n=1 Tax=Metabacillus idriensis TaxID=324768 RepID=UPI002812A600|nr:flagellar hook-length control protein FliK [Metabacillus idriensis]MDR0137369.1 flagellar hook-length control protein FliK [Metabacillus idriensis]